ncbi:MAG: DUF4082 domain-containing protein [Actinomycetota bacterium]
MSLVAVVAALLGVTNAGDNASATQVGAFFTNVTPVTVTASDRRSVSLGVTFSSSVDGTVSGVRFYKGAKNTGTHTGALWSASGVKLASTVFSGESRSGWQTARFSKPVAITKGRTYVASYVAPRGRYSADKQGFRSSITQGALTIPAGGGVYRYGSDRFPRYNYLNTNYYVDVVFTPGISAQVTPPGVTPTPTPVPSITPSPTPTATTPPSPPSGASLSLPRIPWEGGSAYWKKFPAADAAGWTDPNFFPVVVWFNGISSNAEAAYDKSVGINTYIGMDLNTDYNLFKDNGVYWIGEKLANTPASGASNWVGNFMDDEVDGRFTPAEGRAQLQAIKDANAGSGRFNYANFTQIVISDNGNPADAEAYVNNYTDVVSVDMYWYTIPFCDWNPYQGNSYIISVDKANCRTASSYGKTIQMLQQRDAVDNKLQPIWQFVENLNGGPGADAPSVYVTAGQLKGAVMNSVINEARGIVYFNQSLSGSCQGGSIVRQSQVTANFCGAAQVAAASEVDATVRQLAPVINSQSYRYSFGAGLNTMLKTWNGSAYVFAMVDGSSKPGSRTFTLPAGVNGTAVEVVGENRTLAVSGRTFTDSFANEYSYHIYRVAL